MVRFFWKLLTSKKKWTPTIGKRLRVSSSPSTKCRRSPQSSSFRMKCRRSPQRIRANIFGDQQRGLQIRSLFFDVLKSCQAPGHLGNLIERNDVDGSVLPQQARSKEKLAVHDKLKKFFSDGRELVSGWMNENLEKAKNNSYKDLIGIKTRISKHQAFICVVDNLSMWMDDVAKELNNKFTDLNSWKKFQEKQKSLEAELNNKLKEIKDVEVAAKEFNEAKHFMNNILQVRAKELGDKYTFLLTLCQRRKIRVEEASPMNKFYQDVQEIEHWMTKRMPELTSPDLGKDESSTKELLKRSIDVPNYKKKIKDLNRYIGSGDCDDGVIRSQQASLEAKFGEFEQKACQRHEKLHERMLFHEYCRDAEGLLIWIFGMFVVAGSADEGQHLEHVKILQQKFDDCTNELNASEDRVTNLHAKAKAVLEYNDCESEKVRKQDEEISQTWELLKITHARREASLAWQHVVMYRREVDSIVEWIQVKERDISTEDFGDDVESALALIIKHEETEKCLAAIDERFESITKETERLISKFPDSHVVIAAKHTEMAQARSILEETIGTRMWRKKMNQTRQLQLYVAYYWQHAAWIKEMMGALEGTMDMTRWIEVKAQVYSQREAVAQFLQNVQALIEDKHFLSDEIQKQTNDFRTALTSLLETLERTRIVCEQNLEAQAYRREVDSIVEWIQVKERDISTEDFGDDVESALALIIKHEETEKCLAAIDERFESITKETERLISKFPDSHVVIAAKHTEMAQARSILEETIGTRMWRKKMNQTRQLQLHVAYYWQHAAWIKEMMGALEGTMDMTRWIEVKAQVYSQREAVSQFLQNVQALIEDKHFLSDEIQKQTNDFRTALTSLLETLVRTRIVCEQNLEAQAYRREVDSIVEWIQVKERDISTEDFGDDVESALALIIKHEETEKCLAAIDERFESITKETERLISKFPDSHVVIAAKHTEMAQARSILEETIGTRMWRKKMNQTRQLQLYVAYYWQHAAWIKEMMGALEGTMDMTRWIEVKARVYSQREAVAQFLQNVQALIEDKHFLSDEIQKQTNDFRTALTSLLETLVRTRIVCEQNLEAQKFRALVSSTHTRLAKKEASLIKQDVGDTSVEALLKKHDRFESFERLMEQVEDVRQFAEKLRAQSHYAWDEIEKERKAVDDRFSRLLESSKARREKLVDLKNYQLSKASQFNCMVNDILSWMDVVEKQLMSKDNGNDLVSVENLLKKQQLLEVEIDSYQKNVQNVKVTAKELKDVKHFMNKELQPRAKEVNNRYFLLKKHCNKRRDHLEKASLMYQFYRDVESILSWIHEKRQCAEPSHLGTSSDEVQKLIKTHQALESEIAAQKTFSDGVASAGMCMINGSHFAALEIGEKLEELKKELHQLRQVSSARGIKLQAALNPQEISNTSIEKLRSSGNRDGMDVSLVTGSLINQSESFGRSFCVSDLSPPPHPSPSPLPSPPPPSASPPPPSPLLLAPVPAAGAPAERRAKPPLMLRRLEWGMKESSNQKPLGRTRSRRCRIQHTDK